jgi:RNA polymerase sigma-70 factor (ECF subfamily)
MMCIRFETIGEGVTMKDDEPLGPFPATQWSLVDAVRSGDCVARRAALERLLVRYLPALRAYLQVQRRLPHDRASDLLQSFVAERVLERDLLARADQSRGKFRTFLLTALQRYVIDQARAQRPTVQLDPDVERAGPEVDSQAFDLAWAREVIKEALSRMKANCRQWGRPDLWEVFKGRVVAPAFDNLPAVEYDQLVRKFGFSTAAQASNALVTAKRMFERELRCIIGEYAQSPEAIEAEILDLRAIWGRAGRKGVEVFA